MNACRSRVAEQLAGRQAQHMRQILERNDVDLVGAAG
jgi:protein-tyrosine-phosphatase